MASVAERSDFDNPTFDMTIYTVRQLDDAVGRQSEYNTVMLFEQVFEFANLNYHITYDLPIQDYTSYTGACDEPFQTWNQDVIDGNIPHTAEDSNLLLLNGGGGGCSNAPSNNPNRCVAGARPMSNFDTYELAGCGSVHNSAHDILHEVGHNLGFSHVPHAGFGHNGPDKWWRTPVVGGNDMENMCGEYIEPRQNQSSACRYLFYHWCSVKNAELPDEPYAQPPHISEYPPTFNGQSPPHAEKLPRPPAECQGDGDCPTPGAVCQDGECVVVGECTADSDCASDEQCVDNICVAQGECVNNDDCPDGEMCIEGGCVECLNDVDCPGDRTCNNDGTCAESGGVPMTALAAAAVFALVYAARSN